MTATDTVNNGAMGRLGFSFGLAVPHKVKQVELAAIPAMNVGGNSLFELGNSAGTQSAATEPAVLMAKRSGPTPMPTTSNDQLLRQRLSELEDEIQQLREEAKAVNANTSEKNPANVVLIDRLIAITKEKELLQAALAANTKKIQEQELQILKLNQRLDALMNKLEEK